MSTMGNKLPGAPLPVFHLEKKPGGGYPNPLAEASWEAKKCDERQENAALLKPAYGFLCNSGYVWLEVAILTECKEKYGRFLSPNQDHHDGRHFPNPALTVVKSRRQEAENRVGNGSINPGFAVCTLQSSFGHRFAAGGGGGCRAMHSKWSEQVCQSGF